jgi:two-component system CheB/CheR fusion protein
VVMFLDLDNFKVINDTLGHESGDQLLRQASKRIQASVREEDLVARLGGDEFTVILNEAGPAEAKQIARRIIETLASLFRIDDNDLYVSASIGISLFPHDGTDDSTLLKCADTAMYRAKSLGKNNYQFFTEEMKQMAERRLQIETGLRDGLDEGRFSLHLQPKIAVEGGELVGAEALLRWSDPRLGQVSPAEFIPIAEEAGLIIPITQWVISRVCSLISRWRSAGLMVPPISLNLSPNHFYSGHVADDLLRIMAQYGIESQQLVLELTEGTLMGKQGHILEEMNRLHEAGFCLSIDDFGTGYSSLSYLNRYPICELKIDRAFIDNIDRDESASSISRAILAMADALGLKSVAEGVENESQLAVLRSYGCHTFQGYFAYRPLPVEEFMALLPMVKTEES